MTDGRTHHAECWRDHHDCAVREIERLRARVEWPREPTRPMVEAGLSAVTGHLRYDTVYVIIKAANSAHVAASGKEKK